MSFLSQLLEHYHLTLNDLGKRKLPGSFLSLEKPFECSSFLNVVSRIQKAVKEGEKVVIYGDYDVDGLTSTAIMKMALDELGLNPGFFIPSRYVEGYGLHESRVRQFAQKGYQVIICVDNGISAGKEIELAKSLGMEVIVIDHHEALNELPSTPYIFHQELSKFITYNCSAASLAYFVASYLLKRDDPYFATLAGIAVFSDVMPLVGNNLNFAKLAKESIQKYGYKNFAALTDVKNIDYSNIQFDIISSLNAVGRIKKDSISTNNACRFLIEKDKLERIQKLSQEILSANEEKKRLVKELTFKPGFSFSTSHGEVALVEDYSGIAGLLANREMKKVNRPVAIFAPSPSVEDELVGSIRAPSAYRVDEFLDHNRTKLVRFGGHPQAAGVTIKKTFYIQFATLFLQECEKQALDLGKVEDDSIVINLEDLNEENFAIYESFFPFGEGFPEPKFSLSIAKEDLVFSKNKSAVFAFSKDKKSKLVYFGMSPDFEEERYSYFVFDGTFKKEIFMGKVTYSLVAESYQSYLD